MATNNSANQKFTNNSDGYDLAGGSTARKLTVTGADITLTGSGTAVYTFPGSTSTVMAATGAGSSGQILQSAGAGAIQAWSTPTYPSASGTSRKILVSDGTNNIYSTETYAVPGTSGNILTSDGTNWTSAAPALKWSQITAPAGTLSLTMPAGDETTFTISSTTQTGFTFTSSTITTGMVEKLSLTGSSAAASAASSGSILTLTSSTTGFTGATQRLAAIYSTGANGTASVVLQGLDISVANTGTTNTNQALRLSAASGATTNIAVDVAAGEIRLAGAAGSSGQLLQSKGANATPGWTTPTYPSGSATSRKILVSDGTNYVASTETYAVPGTSGNVLTSDGTNWTSAAPAAATVIPQMAFATIFESTTRYASQASGGGTNTLQGDGLNCDTSAASNGRAGWRYDYGTYGMYAANSYWAGAFYHGGLGTDCRFYFGVGTCNSGATSQYTNNHYGLKLSRASSVSTWSATNADGSTETATSFAFTPTLGQSYQFHAQKNGTTNIKYFLDRALKATHTTNLPASTSTNALASGFVVADAASDTDIVFNNFNYSQDAQ